MTYYAFVHCSLNYGKEFWSTSSNLSDIFVFQKRFLRAMAGVGPRESCVPLFKKYKILIIIMSMYILTRALFALKHSDMFLYYEVAHSYATRNKNKLIVCQSHLNKYDDNA